MRLRALVGLMLASVWFTILTGAAAAPDLGSAAAHSAWLQANAATARPDPSGTAAFASIFESASFVGPNRAIKQDRARPQVDVLQVASTFADIRARIASIRASMGKGSAAATEVAAVTPAAIAVAPATTDPTVTGSIPVVAVVQPVTPVAPATEAAATAEVKVAALDAPVSSDALDAIDAVAAPLPQTMSSKLAYARADLPATTFDGTLTDKYGHKVTQKDLQCMAEAIYFESRGESYRGQIAVGQVVMNRVAHRLYPDDICAVVYQNQYQRNACQFSFACDGIPESVTDAKAWTQAKEIAKGVIIGSLYVTEVGNATHYHAKYVYPAWAPHMTKVTKIGMHVFYQFRRGWKFG